jgi:transcriptional regulator with GAF, ATPase, and Fis domain
MPMDEEPTPPLPPPLPTFDVPELQDEEDPDQAEMEVLERERRQLAVLYQVSKRCMSAESLAELDRLLINVLERIVAFDRGFITYQLPTGDWKLVMSPKGDRWERKVVRRLLQTALKTRESVTVLDSRSNDALGSPRQGRTDSRLLLPLASRSSAVGAIFLVSSRPDSFDDYTVDFLSLFADIAALAVVNCARLEGNA